MVGGASRRITLRTGSLCVRREVHDPAIIIAPRKKNLTPLLPMLDFGKQVTPLMPGGEYFQLREGSP